VRARIRRGALSLALVDFIFAAFIVILFLNAQDSYALLSVPITWIASALTVIVFAGLLCVVRLPVMPGTILFLAFGLWLLVVTFVNSAQGHYYLRMPTLMTTGYEIYVALRFANLGSAICFGWLVYYLCRQGQQDRLIRWVVYLGTLFAVYAFYIYLANFFGFPEPPRRFSFAGAEYGHHFAAAFHRALGSFREPNVLAGWLMVPLLLSFGYRRSPINLHSVAMGVALLLTASLSGILAVACGLIAATVLSNPLRPSVMARLAGVLLFGGAILFVANELIQVKGDYLSENVFGAFAGRLGPLFSEGLLESNRGYVFSYLLGNPVPLFGVGLGNANIDFSGDVLVSFSSLYVNILFSGGLVGALLMAAFLAWPIFLVMFERVPMNKINFYLMAGYVAWLVKYGVTSEEIQLISIVSYGLIMSAVHSHVVGKAAPPNRGGGLEGAVFGSSS